MNTNSSNQPRPGGYNSSNRPTGPPPSLGGYANPGPPNNLPNSRPGNGPPPGGASDNGSKFKSPSALMASYSSAPPPTNNPPPPSSSYPNYGNQKPTTASPLQLQQPPPYSAPVYSAPNRPLPPPPSQSGPSYTSRAPPPLSTVSFSGVGAMDSRGSVSSNRNSGSYQQHNVAAPQQMKLFNNITPGMSTNNSSNNLSSYGQQMSYGDISNGGAISPTSGIRRGPDPSRIDPSLMPRPDRPVMDVVFHTKSGSGRRNPPSCNSLYTTVDTGNCAPRLMRTTLVSCLLLKCKVLLLYLFVYIFCFVFLHWLTPLQCVFGNCLSINHIKISTTHTMNTSMYLLQSIDSDSFDNNMDRTILTRLLHRPPSQS